MEIRAYKNTNPRKPTNNRNLSLSLSPEVTSTLGRLDFSQARCYEHKSNYSGTEMRIPSSPVDLHYLEINWHLQTQRQRGSKDESQLVRDLGLRDKRVPAPSCCRPAQRQMAWRQKRQSRTLLTPSRNVSRLSAASSRGNTRSSSKAGRAVQKERTGKVDDTVWAATGTDIHPPGSPIERQENLQLMKIFGGRQNLLISESEDVLGPVARRSAIPVQRCRGDGVPPKVRSGLYGSAGRHLAINRDLTLDTEDEKPPAHPFLRMYQTRPGAFARLLTRDADVNHGKVMPGSTIASLMVPHKSVAETTLLEAGESFEGCIKGATMGVNVIKRKKNAFHNFGAPFPGFDAFLTDVEMAAQWRGHLKQLQHQQRYQQQSLEKEDSSQKIPDKGDLPLVPRAALHTLCLHPKQFVLSSDQSDAAVDMDGSFSNASTDRRDDSPSPSSLEVKEMRRLRDELRGFSDMDYVLPRHLDQLLRQEGVEDSVVDSTVALGKMRHERAVYLNRLYHVNRRKFLSRPSRYTGSLPPIQSTQPRQSRSQEAEVYKPLADMTVEERRERRNSRQRPWTELSAAGPTGGTTLPRITVRSSGELEDLTDCGVKDEIIGFKNDVHRLRWEAERQEEMLSYPPGFTQPRVVLISSKVPRCKSMSKAVRKRDKSILYVIYDFDTWSLQDLLDTVQDNLENYQPGCKAKSVFLICQGAQGCLYLLRSIVLTPQKLRRPQYEKVREFLRDLAYHVSKVPDLADTTVHLLGGQLDNQQGRQLIEEMKRVMMPSLINIMSVDERANAGRDAIELYFDFRKFLLWRAKAESRPTLSDFYDVTRSWSSLAEDGEDEDSDTDVDD